LTELILWIWLFYKKQSTDSIHKIPMSCWVWCYMSVIWAIQEVEIRIITFHSFPEQKVSNTASQPRSQPCLWYQLPEMYGWKDHCLRPALGKNTRHCLNNS
jgi:hypothetical protein